MQRHDGTRRHLPDMRQVRTNGRRQSPLPGVSRPGPGRAWLGTAMAVIQVLNAAALALAHFHTAWTSLHVG